MKIGIIGAENSHTAAIAKAINIDKKIKGFSVDYVWGETQEFAEAAAKAGNIPNIISNPQDMLGHVDAVIVDHRHPKHHLRAVLPFVKKGIPIFIDKPFCYRADEGKEFLATAQKYGAPVTSFSVVPLQKCFKKFIKKLANLGTITAGVTYGPCDLKSPYGGIFFYGIHQVDMALKVFGYDVSNVLITKNGNGATGQLIYSDGKIITMNLIQNGCPGFAIAAVGEKGFLHEKIDFDENMYLAGIKSFTKMFKTGKEPEQYAHILKPVQILEALEKSVKSGKLEKVVK